MAVLTWVVAALIIGSVLWSGDPRLAWAYPAGVLIAFLGWSALWRPSVGVADDGVHVRNVTHSVRIPWAALVHIETRYALTLYTPGRRFVAWSAPAPGRLTSMRVSRNEVNREARLIDGDVRPSDMIGTDSGDAAAVVRERWESGLQAGSIPVGVAEQTAVHRVPDVPVIAIIIVLVTATVWALAATQ